MEQIKKSCLSSVTVVVISTQEAAIALKKQGETTAFQLMFRLQFVCALATSCKFYNRTEHSQDFFIFTVIMIPCVDKLEPSFPARLATSCPSSKDVTVPQLGGGNVFPIMNDLEKKIIRS